MPGLTKGEVKKENQQKEEVALLDISIILPDLTGNQDPQVLIYLWLWRKLRILVETKEDQLSHWED